MEIATRKRRLDWERRLPEMIAPWTHWRLLGDGTLLGDVSGDDLLGALALVERTAENFQIVTAQRVAYDSAGACVREDKGLFEISRTSRYKAK